MSRLALVVEPTYRQVENRARFAFGLMALAWGHEVVEPERADVVVRYGSRLLPAVARWRPLDQPAPAPKMVDGLPLHHPTTSDGPDFLAEIFEWAAMPHEAATAIRDEAGRIPARETLGGRANLTATIAWGSRLVDRLHARLEDAHRIDGRRRQLRSGLTLIGASHDVDFLPTSRRDTTRRVLAWTAVSCTRFRSPTMAGRTLTAGTWSALRGHLEHSLDDLVEREIRMGIRSTVTWVTRGDHRRDPRYDITSRHVRSKLDRLATLGVEHAVHGSYASLESPGRLAEEFGDLAALGHGATGSRQHWLRFGDPRVLVDELARASARYDSTIGFSSHAGFRTGMAHAHPLYDLRRDRVSDVIEIPLVVMDVALADRARETRRWRAEADAVLDEIDRVGVGGVSVLWHDPVVSRIQLPAEFADLYWQLHDQTRHRWVTLTEIEAACRRHLRSCGLAPIDHAHASVTPDPIRP